MIIDMKLFDLWNSLKKQIHQRNNPVFFKEGQIWWCHVGQNVGSEAYGKGEKFVRPVLVFKKLSHNLFLGIPITSKLKSGSWYCQIHVKSIKQTAMLYQVRVMDSKRLYNRLVELPKTQMDIVRESLHTLFFGGKYSPRLATGIDGLPQK